MKRNYLSRKRGDGILNLENPTVHYDISYSIYRHCSEMIRVIYSYGLKYTLKYATISKDVTEFCYLRTFIICEICIKFSQFYWEKLFINSHR